MSVAGIQGTFFSMVTKLLTHSVTSLTSSRIPSFSKFFISLWKASCTDELEPSVAHILQVLHLVSAGTCKVHQETPQFQWKCQSRHQVLSLSSMVLLVSHPSWCWVFLESVHLTISVPSFPTMNRWTNMQLCFVQGSCRMCGCCFLISWEIAGISY